MGLLETWLLPSHWWLQSNKMPATHQPQNPQCVCVWRGGINLQFTYKSFLEIGKEHLAQKKSRSETPPSCLGSPTTHVLPSQGTQAPSAPLHTLCFPLLQCVPMYRCPKSLAPLCIPRLSAAHTAESLGISAGFQQSYLWGNIIIKKAIKKSPLANNSWPCFTRRALVSSGWMWLSVSWDVLPRRLISESWSNTCTHTKTDPFFWDPELPLTPSPSYFQHTCRSRR